MLKQTLSRYVKEVEEDQRVSDLLKILRERDVAENYGDTQTRDHLTAESLDSVNNQFFSFFFKLAWFIILFLFLKLSLKSFPLCMRHLHDSLKQYHHLRHYGRLQYILFLKGIGLPIEENLKFWRFEFSKGTIPSDKVLYACLRFFLSFKKSNCLILSLRKSMLMV